MTNLRVLYLQRALSMNGRDSLAGRVFIGHLKTDGAEVLVGHFIAENPPSNPDSRIGNDRLLVEEVAEFAPDCIVSESGLKLNHEMLRASVEWLSEFVRHGGVLIAEGLGHLSSQWWGTKASADEAQLLRLVTENGGNLGSHEAPYLADLERFHLSHRSIFCRSSHIDCDEWLRPTFAGIDRVLINSAAPLLPAGDVLATTENSAICLVADVKQSEPRPYVWATVRQEGLGYVGLLAGNVVRDQFVEVNPDNTQCVRASAVALASCRPSGSSGVEVGAGSDGGGWGSRRRSAATGRTGERYGAPGQPSRAAEQSRLLAVAASLTAGIVRLSAALRPLTAGRRRRGEACRRARETLALLGVRFVARQRCDRGRG
jgi:hypothetical protein